VLQVTQNGEWEHWSERVPEYIYPKDSIPDYMGILVPNVDNVRTDFLMDCIMKQVTDDAIMFLFQILYLMFQSQNLFALPDFSLKVNQIQYFGFETTYIKQQTFFSATLFLL